MRTKYLKQAVIFSLAIVSVYSYSQNRPDLFFMYG
ncbi:hypothetical protein VINE108274_13215 [Vibrio neptunius]